MAVDMGELDYFNDNDNKFGSHQKKHRKPCCKILHGEVQRRKDLSADTSKTNGQWKTAQFRHWLQSNPVVDENEVKFIQIRLNNFIATLGAATKAAKEAAPSAQQEQ